MGEEGETTGDLEGDEMETRTMTTSERIKLLDMESVHLRRKLAEAEQKLDMAKADRRRLMAEVAELSGKLAERVPLRVYEKAKRRAERRLRHIAEVEDAIRRRNAVIEERGERIKELQGRAELADRERRILDMWPRFEGGEPVWFGDAIDRAGRKFTVMDVKLVGYDGEHCETFLYVESGDDVLEFSFDPGEPAYRPAPGALDADGVPIEVGDTVYEAETGEEYKVDRVYDGTTEPDYPGHTVRCRRAGDCLVHVFKPCHLTHREPDSWKRLERDATMNPFLYCAERGIETEGEDGAMKPTNEAFALDLVRRAKALAGIGVAR